MKTDKFRRMRGVLFLDMAWMHLESVWTESQLYRDNQECFQSFNVTFPFYN